MFACFSEMHTSDPDVEVEHLGSGWRWILVATVSRLETACYASGQSWLAFKFGDPLKRLLSQGGGVFRDRGFTDPFDVWHTAVKRLDQLPQMTEPGAGLFRRQLLFAHGRVN